MSATPRPAAPVSKVLAGTTAVGAGVLAYAGLYEMNAFRLRRVEVPVLPAGAPALRVLHISDLHMTPRAEARQRWVSGLAALEPDLVINTGDNIAHVDAVDYVVQSLGRLLDVPGVFVWGSNDYYAPTLKNPFRYLTEKGRTAQPGKKKLPWGELGAAFAERGWVELTNARATIEILGVRIGFRGTDDAHLDQDHYAPVAGPVDRSTVDLALGVTHAPYRRILDAMTIRRPRSDPGRPHPWWPGLRPGDRRAGHQLRPRPETGQGPLPALRRRTGPPGCTCRPVSARPRSPRFASPARLRRPCSP